jgi:hypothetical protein
MEPLWQFLEGSLARNSVFTPENVLVSLLVAFVLGQLVAWVYAATHSGLSYSRSFVQSLILIAVAVALVMAVIGNSIITAFGLLGALALVRFRNVIKDTRDVAFVFCALVIGMAAGAQRHAVAVLGTLALCGIAGYLHLTGFGARGTYGAFLRFTVTKPYGPEHAAVATLRRFCSGYTLVALQEGPLPETNDCAYQLSLRADGGNEALVAALERVPGVCNVNLTSQEELLEV